MTFLGIDLGTSSVKTLPVDELSNLVLERSLAPRPRSGRQEMLENLLSRVC